MARGMNKVMLVGFVEQVPEMRYTADGQPVTSYNIA